MRRSDASRMSLSDAARYASQVLLEQEGVAGGSRCQAFPKLAQLRRIVGVWGRKQALSKRFWEQETDRTTALAFLRQKSMSLDNSLWGQLRAFNMEPAKMLGAICDELKDVAAEVASKSGFVKCITSLELPWT